VKYRVRFIEKIGCEQWGWDYVDSWHKTLEASSLREAMDVAQTKCDEYTKKFNEDPAFPKSDLPLAEGEEDLGSYEHRVTFEIEVALGPSM
jgi:hypothetical protein